MRVAILDDIHRPMNRPPEFVVCASVPKCKSSPNPMAPRSRCEAFDGLIANRERTRFSRALMQQLPDLRIIAQTGNHAYHIDLAAAEELNIIVAKAAGGFSRSAGELAIGLMLAVMRQIPSADREVKNGRWPTPMTHVLRGKTLGIVGLGHVGRHVAKIATAFEMKVLACGRRLTATAAAQAGAEYRDLDDLLQLSDIVSIHATLSEDTRGLIGGKRLALMKPTHILSTRRAVLSSTKLHCVPLLKRASSPEPVSTSFPRSRCRENIRLESWRMSS